MTYNNFDDLPDRLKKRILTIKKGNARVWVLKSIPALDHRTIIETLNQYDGEQKVNDFLKKIEGHFRL